MKTYELPKRIAGLKSAVIAVAVIWASAGLNSRALEGGPRVLDPHLAVRTVTTNFNQPTSLAFLAANDLLVIEKASGKVQRLVSETVTSTVLDLAVNSGSERGLLGIALHPDFPSTPMVYLYWTESSTGADTTVLTNTPLLGNRVDALFGTARRSRWTKTSSAFMPFRLMPISRRVAIITAA